MRKMTDHCDVQTFFWVWTKLLPLHGCDVMCFGVMCLWFDLLSSDVASCEGDLWYYSGTTLYYKELQRATPALLQYFKVLHQYYSVLQSTTLVLLCTTKYCASTTKYYATTRATLQLHQILHLPQKINVINDLRHIWNVISNTWSK